MSIQRYFLGCPVWNERRWTGRLFAPDTRPADYLRQYAAIFNSVEGNSTFYGLPRPEAVERWREETPPGFQFCCKFPRTVSHELRLRAAEEETQQFLKLMARLEERAGVLFLQLPPDFDGSGLPALAAYLQALPDEFRYAVELRHPDWFDKGECERRLHDLLRNRAMDRVVLDSRALFSAPPEDEATRIAQGKKPRVPVHAVALGAHPLVRFIGRHAVQANEPFLLPWVAKVAQWIDEGRQPYVFLHTPDNHYAPDQARRFHELLAQQVAGLGELPPPPPAETQLGLF
ncbi:MAG TPA: DUF72 domain-containing protein [Candidatus Competibacteraceae bacterium]|nr:DUF72 domain-containing protein [Candidatus Competibacteraceae bacterium]